MSQPSDDDLDSFYPGGRKPPPGRFGNPIPAIILITSVCGGSILFGLLIAIFFAPLTIIGVQVCGVTSQQVSMGRTQYTIVTSGGAYPINGLSPQDDLASRFTPGAIVDITLTRWNYSAPNFSPSIVDGEPSVQPSGLGSCPAAEK